MLLVATFLQMSGTVRDDTRTSFDLTFADETFRYVSTVGERLRDLA